MLFNLVPLDGVTAQSRNQKGNAEIGRKSRTN